MATFLADPVELAPQGFPSEDSRAKLVWALPYGFSPANPENYPYPVSIGPSSIGSGLSPNSVTGLAHAGSPYPSPVVDNPSTPIPEQSPGFFSAEGSGNATVPYQYYIPLQNEISTHGNMRGVYSTGLRHVAYRESTATLSNGQSSVTVASRINRSDTIDAPETVSQVGNPRSRTIDDISETLSEEEIWEFMRDEEGFFKADPSINQSCEIEASNPTVGLDAEVSQQPQFEGCNVYSLPHSQLPTEVMNPTQLQQPSNENLVDKHYGKVSMQRELAMREPPPPDPARWHKLVYTSMDNKNEEGDGGCEVGQDSLESIYSNALQNLPDRNHGATSMRGRNNLYGKTKGSRLHDDFQGIGAGISIPQSISNRRSQMPPRLPIQHSQPFVPSTFGSSQATIGTVLVAPQAIGIPLHNGRQEMFINKHFPSHTSVDMPCGQRQNGDFRRPKRMKLPSFGHKTRPSDTSHPRQYSNIEVAGNANFTMAQLLAANAISVQENNIDVCLPQVAGSSHDMNRNQHLQNLSQPHATQYDQRTFDFTQPDISEIEMYPQSVSPKTDYIGGLSLSYGYQQNQLIPYATHFNAYDHASVPIGPQQPPPTILMDQQMQNQMDWLTMYNGCQRPAENDEMYGTIVHNQAGSPFDNQNPDGVCGGEERKQRRPFTPDRRKVVHDVRNRGACIRCRLLRERCDLGDPCSNCAKVQGKEKIWKQPCLRIKITAATLFRIGNSKFCQEKAEMLTLPGWKTNAQTKTLILGRPPPFTKKYREINDPTPVFEIQVTEFAPNGNQLLVETWRRKNGGVITIELPPVAAQDTRKLDIAFRDYIESSFSHYEKDMTSEDKDPLSRLVFAEAIRFKKKYSSNEHDLDKSAMVRNALNIWIICRCISEGLGIIGEEKFGTIEITDPESPYYMTTPISPILDHQIDTLGIKYMQQLKDQLLQQLQKKIQKRRRTEWYEIFLTIFILLSNLETVWREQFNYMMRHEETVTGKNSRIPFFTHTWMGDWEGAAKMLITYFRVALTGYIPFTLDWERKPDATGKEAMKGKKSAKRKFAGADEVNNVNMAGMDNEAVTFMGNICGIIKARKAEFEQLTAAGKRSENNVDMIWVSQLFISTEESC